MNAVEVWAKCRRHILKLPNWEERGICRRRHRNYLIFYRITADIVEVLHVLHGAQDHAAILFPDSE